MTAIVCGSMAYDTIMVFADRFKHHILPEQVHILNVSFHVSELRREYGGCAGNIAYTLKLFGQEPLILATVGKDFAPYSQWLDGCGIRQEYIKTIHNQYTAQAYITTDLDDNQITAFHPGAMAFSHQNPIPQKDSITLGIVAPDGKEGMIEHASQLHEASIPFIFDPGQAMPLFNSVELHDFLEKATWLALNDYEAQLMLERTGLTIDALAEKVKALIITKGSKGSFIYTEGNLLEIPVVSAPAALDPTGCGDAYRAGLLYGLLEGLDWPTIGRIASLAGSIKVETHGTQNHSYTLSQFKERYYAHFGYRF